MNKEKQRIAIAEACPATFELNNGRYKTPFFIRYRASGHECDPLTDLNAMHEAEMSRVDMEDGRFIVLFREYLHTILGHDGSLAIHATGIQRAEAFLRTIGKWEDDE
jgi:hypothetical protein